MSGQLQRLAFSPSRARGRFHSWQWPALRTGLHVLRGNRLAVLVPALVIAGMVAASVAPDWIAPVGPTAMDDNAILQAPGVAHRLGTDQFGRDILSLLIFGARQSLSIAVCAVVLAGGVGAAIGLVSGYAGGRIDFCLMRLVDIWMSIPPMLLALIIAAALRGGFGSIVLAIGLMLVPVYVRVMRSQVIAVKARPFVQASRAIGGSNGWILWRHILPHAVPQMLVLGTLGIGQAVLTGAALSFIGLGVIADRPDWGFLLSQGRGYITMAWWYSTFPGLAITALVISVNLLGERLRHRLDPRRG